VEEGYCLLSKQSYEVSYLQPVSSNLDSTKIELKFTCSLRRGRHITRIFSTEETAGLSYYLLVVTLQSLNKNHAPQVLHTEALLRCLYYSESTSLAHEL